MAGYISEFFGYKATDKSMQSLTVAAKLRSLLRLPRPVYRRVIERLGGKEKLPAFPSQPASIHFVSYDSIEQDVPDGQIARLGIVEEHCTTVYKVQEAFSSLSLPEGNVYKNAICRSLYPERY